MTARPWATWPFTRGTRTLSICRDSRRCRAGLPSTGWHSRCPDLAVEALSGGNQQKVALARWLARNPRIVLLDEPTRGVDVGAKAEIHAQFRALAAQGVAVMVISSELPDLLALCDRIAVMAQGSIAGEMPGAEATEESLLAPAFRHVAA